MRGEVTMEPIELSTGHAFKPGCVKFVGPLEGPLEHGKDYRFQIGGDGFTATVTIPWSDYSRAWLDVDIDDPADEAIYIAAKEAHGNAASVLHREAIAKLLECK